MQINMKAMLQKLEAVQASNKALTDAKSELNDKIKQVEAERNEIEQLFENSNELIKEQMKKSNESFQVRKNYEILARPGHFQFLPLPVVASSGRQWKKLEVSWS